MSDFSDKLRRGEIPSEQDWENHLIEAHALEPRMTPEAFSGKGSYEALAREIPEGAREVTVVDLACGDGHLVPGLLARVDQGSRVIGIDMAPDALRLARAQIDDPRASFVEARAQRLPLADRSVDFLLCHMAFMLMTPLPPVVAELKRVMKPGGRFGAVIGLGGGREFYADLRKLIGHYVQTHLPKFADARKGDAKVTSAEGLRDLFGALPVASRDFELLYHADPEEVWEFLRNMYYTPILPDAARAEFKRDVLALARARAGADGKVRFGFPMRQISVTF